RSKGSSGWYHQDYGGGIYMVDSTWIRTYGGKGFYCDATIQSEALAVNQSNGALGAWTAVSFGTGWANYGGGYVSARYRRFGDVV
ncbi:MAG: shufflon system plasmid conjugative transfer pilus tip adhesin PilV, partial [Caldilinea sp.]|nr:shufflon system plasmid conjugative transfer pilus tip adhesin PilV [Caldilinea sp.]